MLKFCIQWPNLSKVITTPVSREIELVIGTLRVRRNLQFCFQGSFRLAILILIFVCDFVRQMIYGGTCTIACTNVEMIVFPPGKDVRRPVFSVRVLLVFR